MPGQSEEIDKGGTLRLGSYPCSIKAGTKMEQCYGNKLIHERHRHRYEYQAISEQLLSFLQIQ